LCLLGFVLILAGKGYLIDERGIRFEQQDKGSALSVKLRPKIEVTVAGAVQCPGAYELREDDRLNDLVEMAGGYAEADAERINGSQLLVDGRRYYIPRKDEPVVASGGGFLTLEAFNELDAGGLMEIHGIGPVTAEAILENRRVNGPLGSFEELLSISGIGPKTLKGMKGLDR
jgi:competence protein ComEA